MSHVLASEVASLLNGKLSGDDRKLYSISLLNNASSSSLVVLYNNQINTDLVTLDFGAVILPPRFMLPIGKTYILTAESIQDSWYKVVDLFIQKGLYHKRALHTPSKKMPDKIGTCCSIGTGTVFGENVSLGNNCIIGCNSVIGDDVTIGNNTVIESGAVIGNESFQFCRNEGKLYKVPNIGTVIIGDNVEIGANTTIDRGTIGNTVIGSGTKIGNLVQIGHETVIGENCMIVAQTGISGWVTLGNNVTVYGQVGINNSVSIGDNSVLFGKSGITKNVSANSSVWGIPAENSKTYMKKQVLLKKMSIRRNSK